MKVSQINNILNRLGYAHSEIATAKWSLENGGSIATIERKREVLRDAEMALEELLNEDIEQ